MNTLFFCLVSVFAFALVLLVDSLQYHLSFLEAYERLSNSHVGTMTYVLYAAGFGLLHAIRVDRKHRKKRQSNK